MVQRSVMGRCRRRSATKTPTATASQTGESRVTERRSSRRTSSIGNSRANASTLRQGAGPGVALRRAQAIAVLELAAVLGLVEDQLIDPGPGHVGGADVGALEADAAQIRVT